MNILDTVERGLKGMGNALPIGKSVCGNPILCLHKGSYRGGQMIVTGGIHARECYTALVVLEQARSYRGAFGGAYFVPLLNPDGAAFFESGETFSSEFLRAHASERLLWKANADGVDLNTNFDAEWGTGVHNVRAAARSDYIGTAPMSAPETAAIARFTRRVMPSVTVSYHCMGGELYWEFYQTGGARRRDLGLATAVAGHIGVKRVDGALGSAGGYKDWCIMRLGITAFTIELIKAGSHPFLPGAYAADIKRNADLPDFIQEYTHEHMRT